MGCFSWMFADKDNKVSLKGGCKGYVLCPDGHYIEETYYNCYGDFAGRDIYELVAIWNRGTLKKSMLRKPKRKDYGKEEDSDKWFAKAMDRYEFAVARLKDYHSKKLSDSEMKEKYGREWLREIGIDISCYDEQNEKLPYPIKIVSKRNKNLNYADLPASNSDPNQGCY